MADTKPLPAKLPTKLPAKPPTKPKPPNKKQAAARPLTEESRTLFEAILCGQHVFAVEKEFRSKHPSAKIEAHYADVLAILEQSATQVEGWRGFCLEGQRAIYKSAMAGENPNLETASKALAEIAKIVGLK